MEAIAMVGEALEFFLGTYGLGTQVTRDQPALLRSCRDPMYSLANYPHAEIQGIADAVGLPAGDIALINILYEMVSMCTSVHRSPSPQ
jgi:hypothetical protein